MCSSLVNDFIQTASLISHFSCFIVRINTLNNKVILVYTKTIAVSRVTA